jgi:hypothetical protein
MTSGSSINTAWGMTCGCVRTIGRDLLNGRGKTKGCVMSIECVKISWCGIINGRRTTTGDSMAIRCCMSSGCGMTMVRVALLVGVA